MARVGFNSIEGYMGRSLLRRKASRRRSVLAVGIGFMTGVWLSVAGCGDDPKSGDDGPGAGSGLSAVTRSGEPSGAAGSGGASPGVLIFPDGVRVDDERVNAFVARAMAICGRGEYEPFRLLWSVREEPLRRSQFAEGWQAVRQIRIRALREARIVVDEGAGPGGGEGVPDGFGRAARMGDEDGPVGAADEDGAATETVYLVVAEVRLDPDHPAAQNRPQREVVLMLVQEHGQWRLAEAPEMMREWIREQAGGAGNDAAGGPGVRGDAGEAARPPGGGP